MGKFNEDLRKRLLVAFSAEAEERLSNLADRLALAKPPVDPAMLESVYREIHSLKGASRAVALRDVESLCQSWESLFARIRKNQQEFNHQHLELCRRAEKMLHHLIRYQDDKPPDSLAGLCSHLESDSPITKEHEESTFLPMDGTQPDPSGAQDTSGVLSPTANHISAERRLKVNAKSLDTLLFHIEDLQQSKLEAAQTSRQTEEAAGNFADWHKHRHEVAVACRQIRQQSERLAQEVPDEQQTLLEFSDWVIDYLGQWEYRLNILARNSEQVAKSIASASESLYQEMQNVLLLPCSVLLEGIPVMVREIAQAAGKQIKLTVTGDSLTVDKRILDELKIPLQHLIRNAIDHGLESTSDRVKTGKPESGLLSIEFSQEDASRFVVSISDDGRGLNADKIRKKAVDQKILKEEEASALNNQEIYQQVFNSGLSTSAMITDLSGRGLGLAIVRDNVEQIGGQIQLESTPGQGTAFHLRLPVSMATFRALLVKVDEFVMAIPAQAVIRALRFPQESVRTIENRMTVAIAGNVLPLWRLADVLQLDSEAERNASSTWLQAVQLYVTGKAFCLQVDEIIDDREIILKSLGPQLVKVPNILGATQLGDGRVIPVLNTQDLYKTACTITRSPVAFKTQDDHEQRPKILVAEDSITSRGLLKTILENSGYEVTTANDGMEAWTQLRQYNFDLLISDIEMPHMDGFTLTEKVRRYRTLSGLPVVLVTALQSPEDRERGLEAGANAYIVKSSFDQVNLLNTIRQLL